MSSRELEEEGGEGYFASISDLMVGILFVFLLMLTVFALNYTDDKTVPLDQFEAAERRIRSLEQELGGARQELRQRTEERDAARVQAAGLQAQLDGLRALLAELEARLTVTTLARDVAEARAADLAVELERLNRHLAVLRALIDPDERQRLSDLLQDLASLEAELSDLATGDQRQRTRRDLLTLLRERLRARGVHVEMSAQSDVLRLPSQELFRLGTAAFTDDGRTQADALLEEMGKLLPCYANAAQAPPGCTQPQPIFETVLIEGHTDTLRADNWRLSTDRARAVLDRISGPLAPMRELRNAAEQPLIGLAGYAESRTLPGIPGEDARNRRIEVRFLLTPLGEADLEGVRTRVTQLRERLHILRQRRPDPPQRSQ